MRRIAALAFSIALFAAAQSQPPSPTPTKSAQNNQRETAGKKNKTSDDQRIPDAISTAINNLSAQIAATKTQEDAPRENGNTSTDRWIMWSTITTAIATIAIAYLGYRQWRTLQAHHRVMNRQAGYIRRALKQTKIAAAAANATAQATAAEFELTHRPWISIAIRPASNLKFDASGITLSVDHLMTNIGKSPAVKILMDSVLFLDANGRNVINEREELRAKIKAVQSLEQPSAILPDRESQVVLELHRNQNYINDSLLPGNQYLTGCVITVVTYRSSFNAERLYSTSTIHRITVEGKVTFVSAATYLIDTVGFALLPIQGTTIE